MTEPIFRIWRQLKHISIHKHGICLWGGKDVFGILRIHAKVYVEWKVVMQEATQWAEKQPVTTFPGSQWNDEKPHPAPEASPP